MTVHALMFNEMRLLMIFLGTRSSYSHETRAGQAAILEIIYEDEPGREQYNDLAFYPVFNFVHSLEGASRVEYVDNSSYWDDTMKQSYLLPRFNSLINAYRSACFPSDWRLAECVFPLIGGGGTIHLISLLKPVESSLRTVYCVSRYG